MYCEKCGKELQKGTMHCDCDRERTNIQPRGKKGILYTILGGIGALISFPTFISELQHNTRWRGGIIEAIEMLFDDYFWTIPTVVISVILIVTGINQMIVNKNK